VFEYPCETSFYRVYANHLCDINISNLGNKYLVTGSSHDRTIIIWKILYNKKEDFEGIDKEKVCEDIILT